MCYFRSRERPRPLVGVTLAIVGVVSAYLAFVFLMPRMIRRNWDRVTHSAATMRVIKSYNDFTRKSSGSRHSPFALLTHVGRRSGRTYETSLGACAYGDGFLLPLAYGTGTDWCRNVMAAGTGALSWKGQTHQLERPEIVSGPDVMRAWPARQRITLRGAGIHDFLWLHKHQGKW